MKSKNGKSIPNHGQAASATETTGSIPTPPRGQPDYESYQELVDMEVKGSEKLERE